MVKATVKALKQLRSPEDTARRRGKRVEDLVTQDYKKLVEAAARAAEAEAAKRATAMAHASTVPTSSPEIVEIVRSETQTEACPLTGRVTDSS